MFVLLYTLFCPLPRKSGSRQSLHVFSSGLWHMESPSHDSTSLRSGPCAPSSLVRQTCTLGGTEGADTQRLPNGRGPHLLPVLLGSGGGAAVSSTPCAYSPLRATLPKEPSRVKPLGKVTLPWERRGKQGCLSVCSPSVCPGALPSDQDGPQACPSRVTEARDRGWPSLHPCNLPPRGSRSSTPERLPHPELCLPPGHL